MVKNRPLTDEQTSRTVKRILGKFLSRDKYRLRAAEKSGARGLWNLPASGNPNRNGPALVPYEEWTQINKALFQRGAICVLSPSQAFVSPGRLCSDFEHPNSEFQFGVNALVFYNKKSDRKYYPPLEGWKPRIRSWRGKGHPSGGSEQGQYVIRILGQWIEGGPQGVPWMEYADDMTIAKSKLRLAWLITRMVGSPYAGEAWREPVANLEAIMRALNLPKIKEMKEQEVLTTDGYAMCKHCHKKVDYQKFSEVHPTEVELTHLNEELGGGKLRHSPENIGWGHAQCNREAGAYSDRESSVDISELFSQQLLSKLNATELGLESLLASLLVGEEKTAYQRFPHMFTGLAEDLLTEAVGECYGKTDPLVNVSLITWFILLETKLARLIPNHSLLVCNGFAEKIQGLLRGGSAALTPGGAIEISDFIRQVEQGARLGKIFEIKIRDDVARVTANISLSIWPQGKPTPN